MGCVIMEDLGKLTKEGQVGFIKWARKELDDARARKKATANVRNIAIERIHSLYDEAIKLQGEVAQRKDCLKSITKALVNCEATVAEMEAVFGEAGFRSSSQKLSLEIGRNILDDLGEEQE